MLLAAGCGESRAFSSSGGGGPVTSSGAGGIVVAPEEFLGEVECLPGREGALQSYVAQLVYPDALTDAGVAPLVIETPPVVCNRNARFSVPAGFSYGARILGYHLPAAELRESGREGIPPRWRTECGVWYRGDAGVEADNLTPSLAGGQSRLTGCAPLRPVPSGALLVDLAPALSAADLECGQAPGQVSRVVASAGGRSASAPCGGMPELAGLAPGPYEIAIVAYSHVGLDASVCPPDGGPGISLDAGAPEPPDASAGGDPVADASTSLLAVACGDAPEVARWRGSCATEAEEGVSVTVSCGSLTEL